MKDKEIKIVMKTSYNDETGEASLSPYDTVIYINDTPIGCIQDLKIEVNAGNKFPYVEITFPRTEILCPSYQKDVERNKRLLENIPNVKINTIDLFANQNNMITLDEVGTDGHIDVYRRDFKIGDMVIIKQEAWIRFCKARGYDVDLDAPPVPQRIMEWSHTHRDMVLLSYPLWWFNEEDLELANVEKY